jgi:hypothetical protein
MWFKPFVLFSKWLFKESFVLFAVFYASDDTVIALFIDSSNPLTVVFKVLISDVLLFN